MLRCLFGVFWSGLALAEAAIRGNYISTNYELYNDGEFGHRPDLQFQSSSEFAPLVQVNVWKPELISARGSHIFVRHDGDAEAGDGHELSTRKLSSPLILDANDLSPVYMNRSFANVFGTRVQEDRGKKYLTFWAGEKGNGIGDGYGLAYDDTYQLAYKVSAQNIDVHADLHEFAFTGNGTALVTGVNSMRVSGKDLSSRYGWDYVMPDSLELEILEGVFQEIDLDTNEVLFDWRALDHVNPLDSFEPMGSGWDIYHINSIEKTQAGNYLISIRHTHSIHLIDGKTGAIIWTLGGARNNFTELPSAATAAPASNSSAVQPLLSMSWQHHARFVPGTNETQMTFFDNHAKVTTHGECNTNCSRGLHISLNTTATPPTAQLLRQFTHPVGLQAQSQGSVQPLDLAQSGSESESDPGHWSDIGNVFIGWGRCPAFTEHTESGETVLDVQISPWHSDDIPDALDNYRAYKMDWAATPWWDPVFTVAKGDENQNDTDTKSLVVYVSWNGATEVDTWLVHGLDGNGNEGEGDDEDNVLATSPRTGFETMLTVFPDKQLRYLWVEALDTRGNVLRSSAVLDLNATTLPQDSYPSSHSSTEETYEELGLGSLSSFAQFRSSSDMNSTEYSTATCDEDEPSSTELTLLLSAGLGGLSLTLAIVFALVYYIRWRRRTGYDSLELEASDFDLSPVDIDEDDHGYVNGGAALAHPVSLRQTDDEAEEEDIALLSKPDR